MGCFYLATGDVVMLLALQGSDLIFAQDNALLGYLFLQRLQRISETGQTMAQPDTTHTTG